jgi:hypothetical protein
VSSSLASKVKVVYIMGRSERYRDGFVSDYTPKDSICHKKGQRTGMMYVFSELLGDSRKNIPGGANDQEKPVHGVSGGADKLRSGLENEVRKVVVPRGK